MTRTEQIAAAVDQRRAQREQRYLDLVRTSAEGGETDPDQASAILEDAGKKGEHFLADVEEYVQRKERVVIVERGDEATLEKADILQSINQAKAELRNAIDAAHLAYREKAYPLQRRLDHIENLILQGKDARQQLALTAPADLRECQQQLRRKHEALCNQVENLSWRLRTDNEASNATKERYKDALEQARNSLRAIAAELASIGDRMQEVQP